MKSKKSKTKKRKINIKNTIAIIIIIISLIGLIFSIINIIKWTIDANKTNTQIIDIQDIVDVVETTDTEDTEVIDQEEINETNPYWDYIKMNLIDVNFNDLKAMNKDTKGWIQVNATNVNYPFVQADNNDYYLNHSFDKSWNGAGWVFLDYRNNIYGEDKNTIIYAHGRSDNTLFGTLKYVVKDWWLNNSNNHIVKLSTEYENTLWQVFSVYYIPTTSDYLQVNFISDYEFLEFVNMLKNRSFYNFNTSISADDRILTLSTCYNKQEKVVLHAKLIKRESR